MLRIKLLIMLSMLVILAAACAPAVTESPTPAPIKTDEPSVPVTGVATVENVEVLILESMPLQFHAVIRGQLPDAGCTTIREVTQTREGNTIKLTVVTTTDPLALCAQALTPFEHVIPLDISGLPAGEYTVDAGGASASLELGVVEEPAFLKLLLDAMNARDYETLKGMMGDTFVIGYWQSEGVSYTPDEAIEQLQLNLLSGTTTITVDMTKDLTALLGFDPVTIVGPGVAEVSPVFVTGLGAEGKDEAILFIAPRADGSPYWYGMLFAKDGFTQ
jgi:hypothetical protein